MLNLKLGVALSGGGIRGIAHAGALKAFEDNKIMLRKLKVGEIIGY